MNEVKKGDICLINFPFSDISQTKKRPAVLVSELKGENNIFVQISTKKKLTKNYSINLKKEDCYGNIQFDSYIYYDMIFTLHSSLIDRKIGSISEEKLKKLSVGLKNLF